MVEQLIVGLLLAAAGGISWLAYRHPSAFEPIYQILTRLVLPGLCGWTFSTFMKPYMTLSGLLSYMKEDKQEELTFTVDRLQGIVDDYNTFFICLAVILLSYSYLAFLKRLPTLIQDNENA